ncbi:MAG: hypothetical protein CMK09_04075 [Ponticaulis sp.]|nr:hypothetical protein [Ponticaulis sp.]|tara:strand:- start:17024 stop:17317 length:294 start_codon:yes stop_codon:yes gene_type:complete
MRTYLVYMLASQKNGTLYIGVTNNLFLRVWQHRNDRGSQFTTKYKVYRLVWSESFEGIGDAITREKQLKAWNRAWKIALIERENPNWDDLYDERFVA